MIMNTELMECSWSQLLSRFWSHIFLEKLKTATETKIMIASLLAEI
jgi:hypothetical protein